MYLLVLLGLALSALVPPAPGPPPTLPACLWWLAAILVGLGLLGWLVAWLLGRSARGGDPRRLTRRHGRVVRTYGLVGLAAYAAMLLEGRWADYVDSLAFADIAVLRQTLVVLPFLLILLVLWWGGHAVSAAVRRDSGDADLPVPAGALTLRSYVVFQARQYLLVLLAPYLLIFACRDLAYFVCRELYPEGAATAGQVAMSASLMAIYIFSPVMLRLIWPTEVFPAGPLRDRLEETIRRARVRVRNIILWRTGGLMVNACMTGLSRPLHYVFLSDSLVEGLHPAQVEAVFGHELGHARYRHIPFLLLVALASMLVLFLVEALAAFAGWPDWAGAAVEIAFLLAYWGWFFGYLSRRFERQSDIAGARLTVCPGEHDPLSCSVHRPGEPIDPDFICPYQAWAMGSALERTAALNSTSLEARSWRHFGIGIRIRFLSSLVGRPDLVRRYNRRLGTFKIAFFIVAVALAAAVCFLSWT